MSDPVLSVRGLGRRFGSEGDFVARGLRKLGLAPPASVVQAVEDVSFDLYPGEVLGVVGESGCGKSTLGRMVAGLLEPTSGTVTRPDAEGRALPMQMIFQDPFSSLNPRKRVKALIGEAPRVHRLTSPSEVEAYVADMMDRCGIDPSYATRFPHAFSGGQRQRVGIARALAVKPEILVCDEAVSALDVSIQAQIVNLFMDLRDELGLTYLFISHDLGIIEHISDRVLVMYLGRAVETGPVDRIFDAPAHPYTRALIDGVPRLDRRRAIYSPIKGDIPSPVDPPPGCAFHPRCPLATEICRVERPVLRDMGDGRQAACHHAESQI
ncbi:ABC transporter ATP-binding protein [Histidinibacterium aquaticum]|uniref:ATP-binding cassette domain-containing protein n=1 Tax=Histidinibacterium aquaticum TaxID=2613962 RepID=A0A5J5GMR8_9RHOB|nr:oligopeptide/dipeptide ABC transporter ATP-binding protein [Histidinibacterium aquaticum]KAA9008824.1 ATP-binding cassette domain-containing protein [Histidinibacterium aquaticum]